MPEMDRARVAGQCNFLFLFMVSTAAWACTLGSTAYCNFFLRNVVLAPGKTLEDICPTSWTKEECENVFNDHAVGFWGFQITVPVNQLVCYPYMLYINGKYYTPAFDTKFNSARAFGVVASFFGAIAFFTLAFNTCCPIPRERMKCITIYFLFACLFQGLTLLLKKSNVCQKGFFDVYFRDSLDYDPTVIESVSCSLYKGSNMAIAATVLYFVAAVVSPKAEPIQPMPEGDEGDSAGRDDGGDKAVGDDGGDKAVGDDEGDKAVGDDEAEA